jgi:hypothetical protein
MKEDYGFGDKKVTSMTESWDASRVLAYCSYIKGAFAWFDTEARVVLEADVPMSYHQYNELVEKCFSLLQDEHSYPVYEMFALVLERGARDLRATVLAENFVLDRTSEHVTDNWVRDILNWVRALPSWAKRLPERTGFERRLLILDNLVVVANEIESISLLHLVASARFPHDVYAAEIYVEAQRRLVV